MIALILTAVLSMPAPAWLEADPMPPPAVTAPTGIIDTIRQAKALIGKGNVLADRGKAILDAAQRDGKVRVDICLPVVEAVAEEVDEPLAEPEQIHTAKPIVKPTKLTHTSHAGKCMCPDMCYGIHLVNEHGVTNTQWNKQRLWEGRKMYDLHAKLHAEGVAPKVVQSGCEGGVCRTPTRRIRFPRFGRWR